MEGKPLLGSSGELNSVTGSNNKQLRLGAPTITLLGSLALTINNISGPGMLEFPSIFQSAGYAPCLVVLLFVFVISSSCATLLADAMARIPGNENFQKRYEFSDVVSHFLGRQWFGLTQVKQRFAESSVVRRVSKPRS